MEGSPTLLVRAHSRPPPVLTCRGYTLSTVPWVDRGAARAFPRPPPDRRHPDGGGSADAEGGKRWTKRTGIVFCRDRRPRPGAAQISEPASTGRGRGSVQAVNDALRPLCAGSGVSGLGSRERVEGHGGHCLASSVLKKVQVREQGALWLLPTAGSGVCSAGLGEPDGPAQGVDWGWCYR